jgi:hypothetical protein
MNDVVTLLLIVGGLAVCVFIMGLAFRHHSRADKGDAGAMFGIAGPSPDCSHGGFSGGDCGGGGDGGGGG